MKIYDINNKFFSQKFKEYKINAKISALLP